MRTLVKELVFNFPFTPSPKTQNGALSSTNFPYDPTIFSKLVLVVNVGYNNICAVA